MTLSRCPLCGGGQFPDSSCVDYEYAFRKNLEHIATAESDRTKEFSYLANTMNEVSDRLFGVSIGSAQEKISALYLKQSCPNDHFSEEMADKHGTDIIASVMENGLWYIDDEPVYTMCVGQISISIKKQKKWHSNFKSAAKLSLVSLLKDNFLSFQLDTVFAYKRQMFLPFWNAKNDIIWGAWRRCVLQKERSHVSL